jgi:ribonuclease HI
MDKYMLKSDTNNLNSLESQFKPKSKDVKDITEVKAFYVVKKGFSPGIYLNWNDCKSQVDGYIGAIYKKFITYEDANNFLNNAQIQKPNDLLKFNINKESPKEKRVHRHNPDNDTYLDEFTYIFCDGSSIKKNNKPVRCGFGVCIVPSKAQDSDNNNNNNNNNDYNDYNSFFKIEYYGKYLNSFGTNNFGELNAILCALKLICEKKKTKKENNQIEKYCIVCDSSYALDCILTWSDTWKLNNWMTSNNKPVENQDIIKEIILIYEYLLANNTLIKFKHMNSHQKKPSEIDSYNYFLWFGNEIADKLAKDEKYVVDIKKPELPIC